MSQDEQIALSVGGTFGHIKPALDMACAVKLKPFLIGIGLLESYFLKNCPHEVIGLQGKRSLLSLFKNIVRSFKILKNKRFTVMVCFGSYHSFPAVFASLLLGKKIWVFEPNSSLGKVNRFFLPFAKKIICYEKKILDCYPKKGVLVKPHLTRKEKGLCYKRFGLDDQKPILLVIGGSSGSVYLNEILQDQIDSLKNFQILHLVGLNTDPHLFVQLYQSKSITAFVAPFIDNVSDAMQIANFALTRAGASVLQELKTFNVPSLIVPFEGVDAHQLLNAKQFLQSGGVGKIFSQNNAFTIVDELQKIGLNGHLKETSLDIKGDGWEAITSLV
jgi:UDP-N-acetylglucosamine--N-acetylmuramyl-(pentapeptide) pyrophosphoryl-undecaprenol N-acetylglucosamine transferase